MKLTTLPLLCPPGNGVYTVQTGKEFKAELHQTLYQSNDPSEVEKKWKNSIEQFSGNAFILGLPSDAGGGILRGANWGPLFLRQKLYQDKQKTSLLDLGDIRVIPHLLHDKYLNDETIKNCREFLYQDAHSSFPVSPLSMAESVLTELYEKNPMTRVLSLGGDHSLSYPTVLTWAKNQKKLGKNFALIHFDAHTDLLDKRMGIDLCFGSWTYHVLNEVGAGNVYQIGIRSSGKDRGHWEKLGLKQYWAQEFKQDFQKVMTEIKLSLKKKGVENIYVSFDVDALDSYYVAATGTPESGGLDPVHCLFAIEQLATDFKLTGADIMEVAPMTNLHLAHPHNPQPQTTLNVSHSFMKLFLQFLC